MSAFCWLLAFKSDVSAGKEIFSEKVAGFVAKITGMKA